MKTNTEMIVIFCNTGSEQNAEEIIRQLLSLKLIACGSIISHTKSIYEWQGKIETRNEFTLMLKSFKTHYNKIEEVILEVHTDEVPEIISITPDDVFSKYYNWAKEYCNV